VRSELLSAPDALAQELRRLVRGAQLEDRWPSVSAAVVRGKDVVWAEAVGLADVEGQRQATTDTQYRVGSITKTFTAAAVMQLRDAGELTLDDELGGHIPEAPHASVTLRALLSHLSGFQREPPGTVWETMEFPTREQALEEVSDAEQVLAAGSHWHYSNLAYGLLGEVVARRSGQDYVRYVDEHLLEPLGLARTTWDAEEPAAKGYLVEAYDDAVRAEPLPDLRAGRSAGQLWSTTGDLCRWLSFLAEPDREVLRPETAEEMRAFQGLSDLEQWTAGYGLGLELYRKDARVFFGHSGGMPGFITRMAYSAKEKVGAVVLTSTSSAGQVGEVTLELAARTAEAWPLEPDPWRPQEPVPAALASVLGPWWFEGYELVFRYRDGRLEAKGAKEPPEAPAAVFAPDGDDRFRVVSGPERGELLQIVRDDAGDPVKLYWATYPFTRSSKPFGP
jgi:CubicO group peptidase (beta-lactamase class C family)